MTCPAFLSMPHKVITQDMVSERVSPVIWHGNYFSTRCLFHDDREPSMLVYSDGAYCMGCRKNFSLAEIWKKVCRTTLTHQDMVHDQSRAIYWAKVPPPEELAEEAHSLLAAYPDQGKYLHDRGIGSRIDINHLGWWNGWFTFPGYDANWNYTGLVLRAGPETQNVTGSRYLTPPGQAPFLYVTDWRRLNTATRVFVTFGIIDALGLAALGLPSISPSNGQIPHAELFEPIRKRLVIVPDKKSEELETAKRLAYELGWRGEVAELPYAGTLSDPADYMRFDNTRKVLSDFLARY